MSSYKNLKKFKHDNSLIQERRSRVSKVRFSHNPILLSCYLVVFSTLSFTLLTLVLKDCYMHNTCLVLHGNSTILDISAKNKDTLKTIMPSLKLTTLWQTNNLAGDKTRFTQRTGNTLAHFFKDGSLNMYLPICLLIKAIHS